MNSDVFKTVSQIFQAASQYDRDGRWDETVGKDMQSKLVAEGWSRVGIPEELRGSDGAYLDAVEVSKVPASCGVPSPLADSLLVAGYLMQLAKISFPEDAHTVVAGVSKAVSVGAESGDAELSGTSVGIPWARWSSHIVMPVQGRRAAAVALVGTSDLSLEHHQNLAGEPRDSADLGGVRPITCIDVGMSMDELLRSVEIEGALARSVQMSAAMKRVLELTVRHAKQRVQFGKPLIAFQAVQQYVAELAGEVTASRAATDAALRATGERKEVAVAAAKIRVGTAAGIVSRIAHQVHGAIGVTQEYELQRFTRSLWAWRDEYGGETVWAERLARNVNSHDDQSLWEWVVSGTD